MTLPPEAKLLEGHHMANMTPSSRGHTPDTMSTNALTSHIGSKSVDILSKSGKLCSCNFAIVINEWENPTFLHHYVPSDHSNMPSYARLRYSTGSAPSNVKKRFMPTVQSSITYLYPPAIKTAIDNHAPPSRNVTRNQPSALSLERPQTGKESTKPSSTPLPIQETLCHLPSCHRASKDVHLCMQVHQRQVCSTRQHSNLRNDSHPIHRNEGATYATKTIKYGPLLEKATTAMLWSQVPMHRVMQASIDATM